MKIKFDLFLGVLVRLSVVCSLSSCAGTAVSKVNFNPTEPIRVAVVPFADVNEKGEFIDRQADLLIDDVALVSSKLPEKPSTLMQKLVQSRLGRTSLDVIAPGIVAAELSHHGFADPKDLSIDVPKVFAAKPGEICSHLLSCDAILYGRVTKWDRDYFAIQTVATVGIDLKLISAKDGSVLFESQTEDSDSRGLTKGPTGFSNIVLEPLKGLDNEIVISLARKVTEKALSPLDTESRPDFLKTAPPGIIASADDAEGGVVRKDKSLTVVMRGTPKQQASFSIGSAIEHIPMIERDEGQYIGEYHPLPTDSFKDQSVMVYITDDIGRTTEQRIGGGNITLR